MLPLGQRQAALRQRIQAKGGVAPKLRNRLQAISGGPVGQTGGPAVPGNMNQMTPGVPGANQGPMPDSGMNMTPGSPGANTGINGGSYSLNELGKGQQDFSGFATDLARDRLEQGGFNQGFAPNLSNRSMSEDVLGAQRKAEEDAYGLFTRDFDQRQSQQLERAKQDLANRGIPYSNDPNSQYQQQIGDINRGFEDQRLAARQMAGQEGRAARESLFSQQEQLRANQLSEQLSPREYNLSETEALSRFGQPGVAQAEDIKLKKKALRQQGQLTRKELRNRLKIARIGAARSGGGGGAPAEESIYE